MLVQIPESEEWKTAIRHDFDSVAENKIWTIVCRVGGSQVIATKRVSERELDASGKHSRYKAALVGRCYTQVGGTGYEEMFTPVARFPRSEY